MPLHYGHVPAWLAQRMAKLGLAITESIITEYGIDEVLRRLSDPFWFQSLGAVMGMDWHSSGITTSVLGALKKSINPNAKALGIYICGGKGKHSRSTPGEILSIADSVGFNGDELVRCSKLSAKVDNNAVQDGFQLYTHNFIISNTGNWTVIQQGMREEDRTARRYHWHSANLRSFVDEPHTGVCGINQGSILNLTASEASLTRDSILELTGERPEKLLPALHHLLMPSRHDVRAADINLKRLGAALWLAHGNNVKQFEELLLLEGVGPRTVQSLALVSEVIHGTPSRFNDPARFSFAHGGKDGHPFPVPEKVYDETIQHLQKAVEKAKIGATEKAESIKKLHQLALQAEKNFTVNADFENLIEQERKDSWKYGGRTVFGPSKPTGEESEDNQLRLF